MTNLNCMYIVLIKKLVLRDIVLGYILGLQASIKEVNKTLSCKNPRILLQYPTLTLESNH